MFIRLTLSGTMNWRFHINLEMHTEAKTEEVGKVSDANDGEGTWKISPETGFPLCHLVFNLKWFPLFIYCAWFGKFFFFFFWLEI